LGYWETNEIPAWVIERLTPEMTVKNYDRSDGFRKDPNVSTGSAASSDYTNSGYDRGHMAPAADFAYDEKAMYESFYISNICPQNPNLNRGVWASLEDWVRLRSAREKSLIVVTGPVVTGAVTRIGKNGVAIPHGFYKVVLDETPPKKMIAFFFANREGEDKVLSNHVRTVDEIEALAGLDFFPNLPLSVQAELEATSDFGAWERGQAKSGFVVILR